MDYTTQSKSHTDTVYPIIRLFKTEENFKYLWLRYIESFDLSQHCARCFRGAYSNHFGFGARSTRRLIDKALNEARANYYYLCGVTTPYRYLDNLHIAFRYKEGCQLVYDDGKTALVIDNAERIDIVEQSTYDDEPSGHLPAFNTCRNWRFAYQMTHGIKQ